MTQSGTRWMPAALVGGLVLASCGGGGDGGGGSGVASLTVPSQMTIVDAQGAGTSASLRIGGVANATSGGTDYDNDPVRMWVHDESMEPLDTVNMILCSLDQTGFDDPAVLNAGPYLALIDSARCETGGGGGGDGQTAGQAVEYEEWIVDSTRASDTAPQIVRFWIDMDENYGEGQVIEGRLYGRLTIFESPSETLPYGRFELQFKQLLRSAAPNSQDTVFRGTLATTDRTDGRAEYVFHMAQGDVDAPLGDDPHAALARARVVTDASGDSGQAYTSNRFRYDDGTQEHVENLTFHVAFDDAYLARKRVDGATQVRVFDRNDFDTFAWRYGLYGADDGARFDIESGFPIRTTSGAHGWAGYYGIWFPPRESVTNGMTVRRESYEPGVQGEAYTVFVAPGRMIQQTRSAATLGDLTDEELDWWDERSNRQVRVRWNGERLDAVAHFDQQEERWVPIDPPESLMQRFGAQEWVRFWSAARGEIHFTWPGEGAPTDATEITMWSSTTIDADSPVMANGDLTLYAYQDALRPQVTAAQAMWENGSSPFFPPAEDPQSGYEYVFERSSLTLLHDGSAVTFASSISPEQGRRLGGLYSGPMVTQPPQNVWELHEQPVTYRWETGFEEWNQLRVLRDGEGAFVRFDPPESFEYVHAEAGSPMDGKRFRLQYEGLGNLHGIPHREDQRGRHYPLFTIPTGTVLTNGGGSYKVKVLEGEQQMRAVADPDAVLTSRDLDLDTTLEPPVDMWEDPAIGARPTVESAPRFVGGE